MQATDEQGQSIWKRDFLPFGTPVSEQGNVDEPAGFTGKEYDEDVELYYFNARWYDPELGRFVEEDPLADDPNLYSYGFNSPLNYIDPTGMVGENLFKFTGVKFNGSGIKLAGAVLGAIGALKPELADACSMLSGLITIVDHKLKVRRAEAAAAAAKASAEISSDPNYSKYNTTTSDLSSDASSTQNTTAETTSENTEGQGNYSLDTTLFITASGYSGPSWNRLSGPSWNILPDPDMELEKDFRMHFEAMSTGLVAEDNDVKGPFGNTQPGCLALTASAFHVYINGSLNVKRYEKRVHIELNLNMDPYATNPIIDPSMSAIVFFEVWDNNGIMAFDALDAMTGHSLIGRKAKSVGTFNCKVGDLIFGASWAVENKVFEYDILLKGKPLMSTNSHIITVNASLNFNFGASGAMLWPKSKTIMLQTISFDEPYSTGGINL